MNKIIQAAPVAAKNTKWQFYAILAMAILSWLIPDVLPFIDEIVLAYLAVKKIQENF